MYNIMQAKEGKVFRRIADGQIYGNKVALGYSYYMNGVKLDTPYLNTPKDFEEIDKPINAWENDNIEDLNK